MTVPTLPDHILKPHLRPIQPIPVSKDGQKFVALRDPVMLVPQTVVIPLQAMPVLQLFRGEQAIDQIAAQFNADVKQFIELATGLDNVGLLWGPTFEELENKLRDRIRAQGAFSANSSNSLGTDDKTCREALEKYFEQTEDPEIEAPLIGLVAPHLDYARGWPNYAAAYYPLRNVKAPDRVVILGTNHFGLGDGVVLSEFGFTTPMGLCPADSKVIASVVEKLGRPIIVDQLDHVGEHSVELHLPWLQYCFGNVPVVAALVPDPLGKSAGEGDGRTTSDQFVTALRESLDAAGGQTLFVASSDLSHVGPQFGEPRPVDERRRFDVERHDRDMMSKFISADRDEFLSAFKWNKNPTRWCSIGNMAAILELARPDTIELIDYRQAYDENGTALVSSAAMALT